MQPARRPPPPEEWFPLGMFETREAAMETTRRRIRKRETFTYCGHCLR